MTCLPDISLRVGWELGRFSTTVETLASRYNLVLKEAAMNAKGAAILLDPHPCGHIVYPYTDEGLVGQAVALFASAGLRDGEGVVLIMSSNHCEPIKVRLQVEGIDTEAYERSGQLICVRSEDLIAKFITDGVLDEDLFKSTVSRLIDQARASVSNGHRGKVRVFGEMVSQLREKNLKATTLLEELWNQVIKEHSVALLCTYALHNAEDHIPRALMDLHSHNIERESTVA
jgi:MEDS: MEthanogen/methylotroph, DcmR Sensory domain